ncbi:GIY-YIG nuclease family protein [Thalassotalea profundi]|uniref:Bacteriophage T5 Orf172 DNA-binding domain-containing protein n=1 Tax=Thalassotalea profundi TaxID=2036687 RepID=A0ABQ3IB76_9GAMM|nr:GIY-YIG nuclease family protein [Thalassotalea profundi]GHE77658.1 hypothetical protein GCM10011501_01600 [Thalassotalea profundi]
MNTLEETQQSIPTDNVSFGNVYIMTHSIFSNVIRIGCTTKNTEDYAKELSAQTPGEYSIYFSLPCDNPCMVKKEIRKHFNSKNHVNEFYEISPEAAKTILKREVMKIPLVSTSK